MDDTNRVALPPQAFLVGPAFDRGATAQALGSVDIAPCAAGATVRGSGHVRITFNPDGSVGRAFADAPPFQGTPEGDCIARLFSAIRIPAYSGQPVTVGKTFVLP